MTYKKLIEDTEKEIKRIQDNYEMGNKEEWDREELWIAKLSALKQARQITLKEELKFLEDLNVVKNTTLNANERRMFKDMLEQRIKKIKEELSK